MLNKASMRIWAGALALGFVLGFGHFPAEAQITAIDRETARILLAQAGGG